MLLANPDDELPNRAGPFPFWNVLRGVLVLCSQLISLPPRKVAFYRKELGWEPTGAIDVCLDEKPRLLNSKGKMTDMSVERCGEY